MTLLTRVITSVTRPYLQRLDQYGLDDDAGLRCKSEAKSAFVGTTPAEHVPVARDGECVAFTERDVRDELVFERVNLIEFLRAVQVALVAQIEAVVSARENLSRFGQQRLAPAELFHGDDVLAGQLQRLSYFQ